MAPLPRRLRRIPLQWVLVGLVTAGAAASAVRSSRVHAGAASRPSERLAAGAPDSGAEGDRIARPVEDAFAAAEDGNLDRYLDQFTDPLRAQLARTRSEKGDRFLNDYLARLTAPIKGIALHLDEQEPIGPGVLRVPVEFVYTDRNETQRFSVEQSSGRWRIARIDSLRATPTLIPYGTPIENVR